MRIAAFPAKIARWADADGFNEAFVLHWRKCFSIRSRSKHVRTAAGGTPPFRATATPQRSISICRIEWASGSMLMRHPAVSAVPRRNAFSAVHLRMLLTPPRNAPSSPAALATLSPVLARTALLLATLRTVVRTPQPLFSSSAIQLPARKPDPPVTRTRPRLLEDFGIVGSHFRVRCGDISPWDHTCQSRRIRNLGPVPAVRPVSSIAREQQSQRLQVRR
jgi:hypothetical protein